MNQVRNHAAANTKAMAMYGQLLDKKDYQEMLSKDKVEEIIAYLKSKTHYSDALKGADFSIESYEIMMKRYFFCAYEKLSYFYFDAYKGFFKSLLLRYEVENIKLLARAVFRQDGSAQIEAHLLHAKFGSGVNERLIAKAVNMEEFVDALRGTPYYGALKPFLDEESSLMAFRMEMVLDRFYFYQLYQSVLSLGREDQEEMKLLLGINIDVLNLQWIYRGRRYFDISAEELFNFTLDHGKKYSFKKLKEFCYMDFDGFKDLIGTDDYGDLFKEREYMLERAMERYLFHRVKKIFQKAEMSLAVPVALLFMFEYEIRDLFTIMEAKKYGFEKVEAYLIRDLGRD